MTKMKQKQVDRIFEAKETVYAKTLRWTVWQADRTEKAVTKREKGVETGYDLGGIVGARRGWQWVAAWGYRAEDRPGENPGFCLCRACGAMPPCGLQEHLLGGACTSLDLSVAHPPCCLPVLLFPVSPEHFYNPGTKADARKQPCEVPCRSIFPAGCCCLARLSVLGLTGPQGCFSQSALLYIF